ncbi:hypothetical protein [Caulobacter sp. S45]|uniref:hypothetical protein n=1 Tax=Caulobacter sp. S45 TaxID=1641861 RepID=UPI0015750D84|nr:hypothetical protein [Caulobacter sp. S45]
MKWLDDFTAGFSAEGRAAKRARARQALGLPLLLHERLMRPATEVEQLRLLGRVSASEPKVDVLAHALKNPSFELLKPPIQPVRPADAPTPSVPTTESPQMSDIDKLAKGELTVPAFVTKVVGEINANAALKSAASFVLMLLAPTIEKALGSSTVATSIVQDIEAGLSGQSLSAGMAGLGV